MRTLYVETNDVISWVIRQQGESQNVFQKKKQKKNKQTKQAKKQCSFFGKFGLLYFILKHPF